jgi:hypothetical protein
MKRAAPPIFPFPGHRNFADAIARRHQIKPGDQIVMKGWWPSTISGRDMAGRKL